MNQNMNEAIDSLIEEYKRRGRISKSIFEKVAREYDVVPELLSHWFKKIHKVDWSDYVDETYAERSNKIWEFAKSKSDSNPNEYYQHLAPMSGEVLTVGKGEKKIFVGLLRAGNVGGQGGLPFEFLDSQTSSSERYSFDQVSSVSSKFSKRIIDLNRTSAPEIACERVSLSPERYRYGHKSSGVMDRKKNWCYIAMLHSDEHEVMRINDLSIRLMEWPEIYQISEDFVDRIQSQSDSHL